MAKKKDKGPLLYIYQPFTRTPSIKMQDVYTSRQEKTLEKEPQQPQQQPQKEQRKFKKVEHIQEEVPIEVTVSGNEKVKQEGDEKERFSFKRVKSFKELNIKEKLEYLMGFPKVLPPVPCVFYTLDSSYQGYLYDYQDQEVTIQFHDQTTTTIPLSSIKDIIMIGIKK